MRHHRLTWPSQTQLTPDFAPGTFSMQRTQQPRELERVKWVMPSQREFDCARLFIRDKTLFRLPRLLPSAAMFRKSLLVLLTASCAFASERKFDFSEVPENQSDRKSTRLNSSHVSESRMPSSA